MVRFGALALLILASAGCYSWRPTNVGPHALINDARPLEVRATMLDGSVMTMRNPTLVNDTIVGASRAGEARAPAGELRSLEVRRFSATRTAVLVTAHAATVVGIIAAVIYVQPHYYGF